MKRVLILVLVGVALACASWGRPSGLYPVSGKVTYKGAPAVGATVFLYRREVNPLDQQTAMGVVRQDGSFTIDSGPLGPGAPPGEYLVLVRWRQEAGQPRYVGARAHLPDRLKGRYADLNNPLFHAVVKAEANTLPPFDLSD